VDSLSDSELLAGYAFIVMAEGAIMYSSAMPLVSRQGGGDVVGDVVDDVVGDVVGDVVCDVVCDVVGVVVEPKNMIKWDNVSTCIKVSSLLNNM
jgi:hypothetical protein